jgi:hypothetical protein
MERQDAIQIGTLKRIVAALGGELEITAKFAKGRVAIRPFGAGWGRGREAPAARNLDLA